MFVQELLQGLTGIVTPFKVRGCFSECTRHVVRPPSPSLLGNQLVLHADLYRRMAFKVAGYMGKQIENVLRRRKFNQLGGLQLDRDVRALVGLFVKESDGDPGIRDRLRRLVEISRIMSVGAADELRHYFDGATDSELTTEEVKQWIGMWHQASVGAWAGPNYLACVLQGCVWTLIHRRSKNCECNEQTSFVFLPSGATSLLRQAWDCLPHKSHDHARRQWK